VSLQRATSCMLRRPRCRSCRWPPRSPAHCGRPTRHAAAANAADSAHRGRPTQLDLAQRHSYPGAASAARAFPAAQRGLPAAGQAGGTAGRPGPRRGASPARTGTTRPP
jgi:hypothetical protein